MNIIRTIRQLTSKPNDKPSEGEEFIAQFLNDEGMTFEAEVEIRNLKGDSKSYRVADFYLPRFKTYIEFMGKWNSSEISRSSYREKKEVYTRNNIPCVFLYPDNLGLLKFIFQKRLLEELKNKGMRKELLRFRSILFFREYYGNAILLILMIYFLTNGNKSWPENKWFYIIPALILAYQIYLLIKGYISIFIHNKINPKRQE